MNRITSSLTQFSAKKASLTLLLLATPLASFAQQLKPNELATNIPGATSFATAPHGFDPLTASDQDLQYYGFPPKPNQITSAKAFATWSKAMKASTHHIAPTLQVTNIFHGPSRKPEAVSLASAPKSESNTYGSSNWSGYVNLSGSSNYGNGSFYFLLAEYVVPTANQAFGACTGNWDYSSSWVGIDGWNSGDVLQAGTESDAYCNGSTHATYYSPWFEWYPNGETRITNLPIAAGNDYFVEVWNTNSTTGHAYLVNENTNQYVNLTFYAPSGTTLKGNSAEWVVERPTVGGSLATLTNYIAEPFWDAEAETFAGSFFDVGSSSSQPVTMYNGSNPISYSTLLGPTAFLTQDEGVAY